MVRLSWGLFAALAFCLWGSPRVARASEFPRLILSPPSLDLPRTPPALEGLDGGGYYVVAGRAEPGLSFLEFLVDWMVRIGEGVATLELMTYGGYYGGLYQPSPTWLLGALVWEALHPLLDALVVWGIGSASPWFFPRYFWTLLGAYVGSIVGGGIFWVLTLVAPEAFVAWGLLGTAIAAGITVGTQTSTKRLRRPVFLRRRWRRWGDAEPPSDAPTLSASLMPAVGLPPFLAVEF